MKRIAIILISAAISLGANAQHEGHEQPNTVQPVVAADDALLLKETNFDFGKIPQGKPVYHIFTIINNGKTELKLDNVQASCGCTTPEWSREAIPAGARAEIKVGYNAAAEGMFNKPVTITYNGSQTKQLFIQGTVWRAPEGPAPANAAVDMLKKQTF